jgi:hypothetical protein
LARRWVEETAIIVLDIVALIYICILLYQQAYLKSIANHVAERGAACWSNISKMEIDTNGYRLKTGKLNDSKELLKADLYWSDKEEKINRLKKYTIYKIKRNNILESQISKVDMDDIMNSKDKVDICIKDYIVYKELNVVIKDSYKIPLGDILRCFGFDNRYDINVNARAVINDPMEFIRNTDFIINTLDEYEATSEILSKYKVTLDKIKENINSFFGD